MKPRILIVMPCDLPVPVSKGGAVATLIESLLKENEKQQLLDITVITSYDETSKKREQQYPNVNFLHFSVCGFIGRIDNLISEKRYLRKLFIIRFVKAHLEKEEYDRVVFQNSFFLLQSLRSKKLLKKYDGKLYYHLHNDIPWNVNTEIVSHCKLLLVSNYLKIRIKELCGEEMLKNCLLVKNGINIDKWDKYLTDIDKQTLRNELDIPSDNKVAIFVGRITQEKGIVELLHAFERLNRDDVTLLIVGSTNFGSSECSDFELRMKDACKKLGRKVVTIGYVPNDELWKYYKLSDVAVMPSVWNEPAGLTMIESVVCGLPLITTKAGGIPEYLNDQLAIFVSRDNLVDEIKNRVADVFNGNLNGINIDKHYRIDQIVRNYSESKFYQNFTISLTR